MPRGNTVSFFPEAARWPSVAGSVDSSRLDKQARVTKALEQVSASKMTSMRADTEVASDSLLLTASSLKTEADQAKDWKPTVVLCDDNNGIVDGDHAELAGPKRRLNAL